MNAPQKQEIAAVVERLGTGEADNDFDRLLRQEYNPRDMLAGDGFDKMLRLAHLMADGNTTVPKHLQGKVADCMAVVTQAMQWNMNPFAVAQKTHVVNGTLGYEAQLVNAVVTSSGAIRGHFHYEHRGDGQKVECRAGAVLRGDEEITWNEWLSADSVKVKNSPLWATNPKQQLGYLQVKNWSRLYAPSAILGVYTPDELDDKHDDQADRARGPRRKSVAALAAAEQVDGDGVILQETKPAAAPAAAAPAPAPAAATTQPAQGGISGGQVAYLRNKLKSAEIAEQTICDRFQVQSIELLSVEQFDKIKSELLTAA